MSSKSIIFSGEMICAILSGNKTMERRVIKPQPVIGKGEYNGGLECYKWRGHDFWNESGACFPAKYIASEFAPHKKGDILYVRETWCKLYDLDGNDQIIEGTGKYYYAADNPKFPYNRFLRDDGTYKDYPAWKPSIHMPRKAARIFLRVTGVRAERLQDITHKDACCEGVSDVPYCDGDDYAGKYRRLWDELNAKLNGGIYLWEKNPWVWVYEFERVESVDNE